MHRVACEALRHLLQCEVACRLILLGFGQISDQAKLLKFEREYLLLLLLALPAWADTLTGKIVGISDGDTVTLLDATKQQHKIRLQGIDAPEKAQPFGQRSKQHLADLIHGREVTADCGKVDKYRRRVCKILHDGRDVNLQQIEAGLAWWFRKYSGEQSPADRASYEAAELEARSARRGLWRDAEPMAPWEWRQKKRAES